MKRWLLFAIAIDLAAPTLMAIAVLATATRDSPLWLVVMVSASFGSTITIAAGSIVRGVRAYLSWRIDA